MGIIVLSNLICLYPVIPNLHYDIVYSLDYIVEQFRSVTSSAEHYIDVHLLGQAVHHNKKWLESNFGWRIHWSENTSTAILSVGQWPTIHRRYTIAIPKSRDIDAAYSVYQEQRNDEIRTNKRRIQALMLKYKVKYRSKVGYKLHRNVHELSGLLTPEAVQYLLLHGTTGTVQGETSAGSRSATTTPTSTSNVTRAPAITNVVSPPPPPLPLPPQSRTDIDVSQAVLESSLDAAAECRAYCSYLTKHRLHTMDYFVTNGVPPPNQRAEWIIENMPQVYGSVFSALLSLHLQRETKIVQNKRKSGETSDTFQHRLCRSEKSATRVKLAAIEICENMAFMNSGGTVLTCSVITTSMLLALGGTTRRVREFMATRRISLSTSTTGSLVTKWLIHQEYMLGKMVSEVTANSSRIMVVVADNYCTQQYAKNKSIDAPFTHGVATVSVLFSSIVTTGNVPDTRAPIMQRYSVTQIAQILSEDGIILSERAKLMRDTETAKYQGLKNYRVHSSLNAKSSSYDDTDEKLVKEVLENECCLHTKPVILLVDTEFVLTLYRAVHLEPERFRNLFLVPPIFHIRMHIVQNLMSDPLYLLLLVLPYYYFMGLQRDKCVKKAKEIVALLRSSMQQPILDSGTTSTVTSTATSTVTPIVTPTISSATEPGRSHTLVSLALLELEKEEEYDATAEMGANTNDILDPTDSNEMPFDNNVNSTAEQSIFTSAEWCEVYDLLHKYVKDGYRARNTAFSYRDMQKTKINYARCLYLTQVLAQATKHINLSQLSEGGNWASASVVDFLQHGVKELAIEPFSDIILNGNAITFLEKLHTMTQYLAHCQRDKVVRSLLTVAAAQIQVRDNHPWLHTAYLSNCTLFNDNNVENYNGTIRNYLPHNCLLSADIISRTALLTQLRRDFFPSVYTEYGIKNASSSRGRGEIYHEETRHTRGRLKEEHVRVTQFLMSHITTMKQHSQLRRHSPLHNGMNLLSGVTANGKHRLTQVIAPSYAVYLQNQLRKYEKANTHQHVRSNTTTTAAANMVTTTTEQTDHPDTYHLNKYPKTVLYAYIRYKQYRGCSTLSKGELIKKILNSSTKVDFLTFIIENNLNSATDGEKYGRAQEDVEQILQMQQQQRRQATGLESSVYQTTLNSRRRLAPASSASPRAPPRRRMQEGEEHGSKVEEEEEIEKVNEEEESMGNSLEGSEDDEDLSGDDEHDEIFMV